MWKQLTLILWKNAVIRKRHWLLSLTEILIPIILFTLVAYGRSKISGMNKIYVNESTYHEIHTVDDIYCHLDVGELNLWYTPYNDFTEAIMSRVQQKLQIRGESVKEFASKDELLTYFEQDPTSLIGAVIFNGDDQQHLNYDLTIYDKYFTWNTDKLFTPLFTSEEKKSSKYIYKGYAALQVAIDLSYIEFLNKVDKDIVFSLQEFPLPPRTIDSGLNQLFMYFLPLITIFSFIFLCPAVLKRVGEEKSSGTKEFMKMVGLRSSVIWLGWFVHALITNLFSIIVIVVLMKVPLWGVLYPPIEYADGTVLFVFLFLYCMASITFCFLLASLFNSPSIGTIVGMLIWIFSYFIPQTFISLHQSLSWKFKIIFAIFPNMSLYYGYTSISFYEMREVGIQWDKIFDPGSGDDEDFTMGNVFVTLLLDTFIFMLLTLYVENVRPGEYGIAKPFYFPFTNIKELAKRCFTCRVKNTPKCGPLGNKDVEHEMLKTPCIQISNLKKIYANHVAVDDLDMDIYKNHITVLLGQNGAGKTTTMSIITGMINATSGDVKINGKDIRKDTNEIRKDMGLCPQHNLLFPDLTVLEHLQFSAKLRDSKNPTKDAEQMLKKLDLYDKSNEMTNILSGGMKRKLCLGMALIGNSQVLVLDEPTSGMDPESRRKIWDMLLECRKSRSILITTHFMEEADVLGDYISIMANGRKQCFGTPIELKTKYQTGYRLSLVLQSRHWIEVITNEVRHHFRKAYVQHESDKSVVYVLPLGKDNYDILIESLEEKQGTWKIENINIDLSTLDDVFLKAKQEIDKPSVNKDDLKKLEEDSNGKDLRPRIIKNFFALITKRFYFIKKKYYWFIPAIIVTVNVFLLAIWLALSENAYSNASGPTFSFTLDAYGKPKVYHGDYLSSNYFINNLETMYSQSVLNQGGQPVFENEVSKGIITEGINNIVFYKRHMIVAAEFNSSRNENELVVNAMYSSEAEHSIPITINLAMNAIVKTFLNESYSIATSNTPLKSLFSQSTPTELSIINVASVWLILIPMSMFFFMSNFIVFPHTEVSTKFMQIQIFAGVKTYLYWLTHILFDLLFSVVPIMILFSCLCILNWLLYDNDAFQVLEILTLFVIVTTYVSTSLPSVYLLSHRKTITEGFTLLLILGIFGGIIPALLLTAMEYSGQQFYKNIAYYLKPVIIAFSPECAFSYVTVKFSKKYVENFNWKHMEPNKKDHICRIDPNPCCVGDTNPSCYKYQNYFSNEKFGIQTDLLLMISSFVLYFLLLLFLNTQSFRKIKYNIKYFWPICARTPDVSEEEGTPLNKNNNNKRISKALVVENLTKMYGKRQIVKNLNFNLKKNTCFGLLGVNGAGKSTTFHMLTKYLFFDKGEITLESTKQIPIKDSQYCDKIGYCPQENYLNYYLTGRQLLRTMARVKGYSNPDAITDYLLKSFDLTQYADKPCAEYSGGNKRKLSTCLAFLGSPEVILLDEPTSGVDPSSRRKFWKILSHFKQLKNMAFLLCSHSMEESENLCDEIAIMKNGTISDRGTLKELKEKYNKGFSVSVDLNTATTNIYTFKKIVKKELKADDFQEYAEKITFRVKEINRLISELFASLKDLKNRKIIKNYVVKQCSLEDVFLKIAHND